MSVKTPKVAKFVEVFVEDGDKEKSAQKLKN